MKLTKPSVEIAKLVGNSNLHEITKKIFARDKGHFMIYDRVDMNRMCDPILQA